MARQHGPERLGVAATGPAIQRPLPRLCASLEATLPHRWLWDGDERVQGRRHGQVPRPLQVDDVVRRAERRVAAKAVILATGPVGRWVIPAPFEPLVAVGSPLVLHTEALLAQQVGTGATLSEEITRRCPGGATRVLVIGGGISAAQAALAAFRAGHRVVPRSRRPLRTRAFDVGSEWLDVRTADRLRFDFLCLPMRERRRRSARRRPAAACPRTTWTSCIASRGCTRRAAARGG